MKNAKRTAPFQCVQRPGLVVPGASNASVAAFLTVLVAGCGPGQPAFAQAAPLLAPGGSPAVVSVTPSQISAAAVQGETLVRTVTFRSSQTLARTQLTVPDTPGANMRAVLPAGNVVAIQPVPQDIPTEQFVSVPLKIELGAVPSGQYTGQVFLSYAGGVTAIPFSVSVKDRPWWPLALLVLGIVTGRALSAYRAQGQPRDQIIVQIGRLYQMSRADQSLPASFQDRLRDLLDDADAQIKSAQWDAAKLDAAHAQAVWDRWNKDRTAWKAQFTYLGQLEAKIGALPQRAGDYLSGLLAVVQRLGLAAAEKDSPDALAKEIAPAATALTQYLHADADLKVMGERRALWPADSAEAARYARQTEDLRRDMDQSDPTDAAATEAIRSKIAAALEAMTAPPAAPFKALSFGGDALLERSLSAKDESDWPSPPESGAAQEDAFSPAARRRAQDRLRAMQWLSYCLVVLLLAGSGFGDLYAAKPTFGANGWGDYFGLIAWGLGAHAASAAAGDWLGSLPGIKPGTQASA